MNASVTECLFMIIWDGWFILQLFKKHTGLYMPTPVIEEHKSELEGYETTNATILFDIFAANKSGIPVSS